jgi:hypothetical protein
MLADPNAVDVAAVIRRIGEGAFAFVGVVEYYGAAMCMLKYYTTGSISSSYACGAEFQDTMKHTHSTPPHSSETDLDQQLRDKICELTIADEELYAHAKKTFLEERRNLSPIARYGREARVLVSGTGTS